MENKEFDKIIRDALNRHETDFNPNDWDEMEKLLEEEERVGKELLYIKGVELILVILAVFTLFRVSPDFTPSAQAPFENIEENHNTSTVQNNEQEVKGSTEVVDASIAQEYIAKNNTNHSINHNTAEFIHSISNIQTHHSSNTIIPTTTNTHYNNNGNHLTHISNSNQEEEEEKIEAIIQEEKEEKIQDIVLEYKAYAEAEISSQPKKKSQIKLINIPQTRFRLGVFTSIDQNKVLTPYNKDVKASHEQLIYGMSGGLSIALVKKNWEFESGLIYTRKKYTPQTIYEITGNTKDGYQAKTLNALSFNTISIPLNIKYYLNLSKWRFYALAGSSANVLASSNHHFHTYDVLQLRNSELSRKNLTDVDIQQDGLFHNSSIKDIYYITANLGIGVERTINSTSSVFIQPNFTYHLMPNSNGLGPNNDRFNTLSLTAGLKFNL